MSEDTAPESRSQLIVAMAIVGGLVAIGVAMVIAVVLNPAIGVALGVGTAIGTIVGILGTALNAPSGIGKVISAAKAPPANPTQPLPGAEPKVP